MRYLSHILKKCKQTAITFFFSSYRPDTIYPIRIQAVNAVGPGVFSSTTRLSTRPLPPAPPRCECVNATHNSLKLKWGDNKSSNTLLEPCQYTLEMEKSRNQYVSNYYILYELLLFYTDILTRKVDLLSLFLTSESSEKICINQISKLKFSSVLDVFFSKYILWKSRYHILVTFPSHLKKIRSIC